jgi:hypothetical protein
VQRKPQRRETRGEKKGKATVAESGKVMEANPIKEVWRIKDELAREAAYDVHRLCENTRKWAEAHGRTGPVIRSPQELRAYVAEEEERRRAEVAGMALKEEAAKGKSEIRSSKSETNLKSGKVKK